MPRLAAATLRRGGLSAAALALDLAVPPLAMAAAAAAALWAAVGGSAIPLLVALAGGMAGLSAVVAAWARFGRDVLPAADLAAIPRYVAWKLPIYVAALVARQTEWIRTDRTPAGGGQGPGGVSNQGDASLPKRDSARGRIASPTDGLAAPSPLTPPDAYSQPLTPGRS